MTALATVPQSPDPKPEFPTAHPRGLYVLALTEFGERGGYYGMLALLPLYLTEVLRMGEGDAGNLTGTYTASVFLAALPGGFLADKKLGTLRAAALGMAIMVVGHLAMALGTLNALYAAFALIAAGNGLFKPSMASRVSRLYAADDPRREAAFYIFYLGVNLGAFVVPLLMMFVRSRWGFHAAFGVAGGILALSLAQFWLQRHHLNERNLVARLIEKHEQFSRRVTIRRFVAVILMSSVLMAFWIGFNQQFGTLEFWTKSDVNRHGIPPEAFSSVNPLYILLLTVPVTRLCARLRLSVPVRMVLGMLWAAVGFGVLVLACVLQGKDKANMGWLIGAYFAITVGELFVSPMSLSLVTKIAPPRLLSTVVGLYYLFTAGGSKLAGRLGKAYWEEVPHSHFFGGVVLIALVAAGVMACFSGYLRRVIKEAMEHELRQKEEALRSQEQVSVQAEPALAA